MGQNGDKSGHEESAIKVVDALSTIRKHPDLYIRPEDLRPEYFATRLAEDARGLGAWDVALSRNGMWWLVSSADDWLTMGNDLPVAETFRRILVMPGRGLFAMRSEVLLAAFAAAAFTRKDGEILWISGTPDRALAAGLAAIPAAHRVVGFRF